MKHKPNYHQYASQQPLRNPNAEALREKIDQLKAFQTPRIAKELYNLIYDSFDRIKPLRTRLFCPTERFYFLDFKESVLEELYITFEGLINSPISSAIYIQKDPNNPNVPENLFGITTLHAEQVEEYSRDIQLGRIKKHERVPIRMEFAKKNALQIYNFSKIDSSLLWKLTRL